MITIIEKRIQELENRIPVYEATIRDLTKRLEEVSLFEQEIQQIKESISLLNSKLSSLDSRCMTYQLTSQKKTEEMDKTLDNHQLVLHHDGVLLEEFQEQFKSYKDVFSVLQRESASAIQELQKIRKDFVDQQKTLVNHFQSSNQMAQTQTENADKLKFLQEGFTKITALSLKHDAVFNELSNLKDVSHADMTTYVNRVTTRLEKILRDDLGKPQVQAKSYDQDIADIRKDLSTVLGAVHVTATHLPDTSKQEAKLKTLEDSIAQIYQLLKKYESR